MCQKDMGSSIRFMFSQLFLLKIGRFLFFGHKCFETKTFDLPPFFQLHRKLCCILKLPVQRLVPHLALPSWHKPPRADAEAKNVHVPQRLSKAQIIFTRWWLNHPCKKYGQHGNLPMSQNVHLLQFSKQKITSN